MKAAKQKTATIVVPSEAGIAAESVVWGPIMWDILFCAAFESKLGTFTHSQVVDLLCLLPSILPCPSCRASCEEFCKHLPPAAIPDGDASQWLWTMKDTVNQKLNRPQRNYDDVKRRYAAFGLLQRDATVLTLCVIVALGGDDDRAGAIYRFFSALVAVRPSLAMYMQPGLTDVECRTATRTEIIEVAVAAVARQTGCAPNLPHLMAQIIRRPRVRPPT